MRIPWWLLCILSLRSVIATGDAGGVGACEETIDVSFLQVTQHDPPRPFNSFAGGGQAGQAVVDPMGSAMSTGSTGQYPTYPTADPQTFEVPKSASSWENKREPAEAAALEPHIAGAGELMNPGDPTLTPLTPLAPAAADPVHFASQLDGNFASQQPAAPSRGEFANGASRFAGGAFRAAGSASTSGSKLSPASGVPSSLTRSGSYGNYGSYGSAGSTVRNESPDLLPVPSSGSAGTAGSAGVLASGMAATKAPVPAQMLSSDEDIYSVNCGTTVIQPKAWHFTFRPPNTGDFNIPITVPETPHQKSYQIAQMEVSVSADLDNWQPFQLRLIAPSRTTILLKESGSSECADLRCDFTETNSCHSCTRPMETLSAFTGESALGTWILSFEDSEQRKRTNAMAWAALKITWSCEPPVDQQPQ